MKKYVNPEVEVVELNDVIVTSDVNEGTGDKGETGIIPGLPTLPPGLFGDYE